MRKSRAFQYAESIVLHAMLHSKLTRPEEGMEDLLTSNVFGMLKYIPIDAALLPFLRNARNPLTGDTLSVKLPGKLRVTEWEFWPQVQHGDCGWCEPDVQIVFSDEKQRTFGLFIEAKYRSGKSSFANEDRGPPADQLAKELDNLQEIAREEGFSDFAVVYVTADFTCPVDDIKASVDDYERNRERPASIYWQSWRSLADLLPTVPPPFSPMANDLRQLLLKIGLTSFTRLRIEDVCAPNWTFFGSATPITPVEAPSPWALVVVGVPQWSFGSQDAQERKAKYGFSFSFNQALPRVDLLFSWRSQK